MENIKTLEKQYFWLRFRLLVQFFLKNRKPTWVSALTLIAVSIFLICFYYPNPNVVLEETKLTIKLIITVLTLFFIIVVWWVELRKDWRRSLPKYLHARFFYGKDELKEMSDVRYARVIDEGDMRSHAQQIGGQKIIGRYLAIDASCYEIKKVLKYGLIEEYGEPEAFWHFIITTQLSERPTLKTNNPNVDDKEKDKSKDKEREEDAIIISIDNLYQENAMQKDLSEYIKEAEKIAGSGKNIVLTGGAPVWLYLTLAHALHGKVKTLKYRSPEAGDVLIVNHKSH